MCSRATIASSTWNKYQLTDNFYSLLAASICCQDGAIRKILLENVLLEKASSDSINKKQIFGAISEKAVF